MPAVSVILLASAIVRAQTPPAQKPQPQAAAPQTPAAPVVSPEVLADHRVTFRFRAPYAKDVSMQIDGASKPLAMQKDEEGIWSATTETLAPDYYGYTFFVDGVAMFDPSNSATKPNFLYRASELHIPFASADSGDASSPAWEIADVPHGEVHHHFYRSKVVGDERGYFVYTPPGYNPRGKQSYPVLVFVARLQRRRQRLDSCGPRQRDSGQSDRARQSQADADRDAARLWRTGDPMGGAESLLTGLNTLNVFAWIGAFSSGGITPEFDKEFPGLDARANAQLRLLWIACGTDDRLMEINRTLRTWLASKNIRHVDVETPGAHTWLVWRRNLTEFVPLLFR
jgi:enterochelin esterase-like enzyme